METIDDVVQRTSELQDSGFDENLTGEVFYGMHELEGKVQLGYSAGEDSEMLEFPVRVYLGRDIDLPQKQDAHDYKYPGGTWLQELFIDGFSNLAGQKIVLTEPFLPTEKLAELKEDIDSSEHPVTMFYVHGGAINDQMYFVGPQKEELHRADEVLSAYRERFNGSSDDPVIFLTSCGVDSKGQPRNSLVNPGFKILYRTGVAGSALIASGEVIYDKPSSK